MLFTMKLYSRKDIFKKQLLFIVFKGFNFVINFIINYSPQEILLNKRSELISKCRHENKNMLPILETVAREIMIAWINIVY